MTAPMGLSWEDLDRVRIVDLAHGMERGMPVSPNHPAYQMALMRRHGDMIRSDGGSAANEIIVTGGHVGTHVDALCHVSQEGRVYGGADASSIQSQHGFSELGVDTMKPVFCRGVHLDIPAVRQVAGLDGGDEVTVADLVEAEKLAGIQVRRGDAVLIRTGWARHWNDPEVFRGQVGGTPGPGPEAAAWLVERGARISGAETIAYERIKPGEGHSTLPVHRILLVEAGIHIIEVMDLTPLADDGISEFLFVLAPLRLIGATGSPVRPLAIIDA